MQNLTDLFEDKAFIAELEAKGFNENYLKEQDERLAKLLQENGKLESKDFHNKWKKLWIEFWEKQNRRCALCEKKLNSIYSKDIEHYYPKSLYWWLAYDYTNYYLSCADCNRSYKKDKFPLSDEGEPLLINPTVDNPLEYFELSTKRSARLGSKVIILKPLNTLDKNSLEFKKAEKTIEILNLDLHKQDDSGLMLEAEYSDFFLELKIYIKKLNQGIKVFSE